MSLTPLPTLDDLARDPAKAQELPPEARQALSLRALTVLAVLATAPGEPASANGQGEAPAEDRLLTVEETARKLGMSEDWCYRQAKRLPFAVRIGRQLRFSERGIERYIRQRQGR